ncbi:hypothetical protein Tco_0696085 [Tanacetum coccineum]
MASESTSSQQSQQLIPSSKDKPLSFTQDEFISAIGLPICKDVVPLPLKETVRTRLTTLGLFDKDKPTLSSTILVNSSPLKKKYFLPIWKLFMQIVKCLGGMQGSHDQMNLNQQTIAYYLIWGLEIDIGGLFSQTWFISFKIGRIAKLSEEPEQSLIPPFGEAYADDTIDKSLSRAFVQPVTQSKATIDPKTKKKKIPPSSKPKSPYKVRVLNQNFKEEKDAEFVAMKEVAEEQSLEFPIVKQLLDEADKLNKAIQETLESLYDTESEIKVVKSFLTSHISKLQDQSMHDSEEIADIHEDSDSDLQSIPDDDLRSVSGFDTADFNNTHKNEVSKSDHIFQDDNAFAECLSLPDHMDHICEEVQKNLQDQLSNLLLKLIYKEFNAFNKLESQRFVLLQKELSKSLHKNMRKSIRLKDMVSLLEAAEVFKKANAEGEKWEKNNHAKEKDAQHPDQTKGEKISGANTADIEMKSKGTVLMEDNLDDDELDKQPLSKRYKIMTPIPNPIPLNTFALGHLLKPEEQ